MFKPLSYSLGELSLSVSLSQLNIIPPLVWNYSALYFIPSVCNYPSHKKHIASPKTIYKSLAWSHDHAPVQGLEKSLIHHTWQILPSSPSKLTIETQSNIRLPKLRPLRTPKIYANRCPLLKEVGSHLENLYIHIIIITQRKFEAHQRIIGFYKIKRVNKSEIKDKNNFISFNWMVVMYSSICKMHKNT